MPFVSVHIKPQHVFDYALGKTDLDPIERALGDLDRYEVLNEFIYDHDLGCNLLQNQDFKDFSSQLHRIRKDFASLLGESLVWGRRESVKQQCKTILPPSPLKIYIR